MSRKLEAISYSSPLSMEEIQLIDQTNLPILEKHHLRLLAHCLACFKSMAQQEKSRESFPEENDWVKWCLAQPRLQNDNDFISLLLEQFSGAAKQLQKLALDKNIPPLKLNLEDLINAYKDAKHF